MERILKICGAAALTTALAVTPVVITFAQGPQRPKDYVLTVDSMGTPAETALVTKVGQTYLIEASGWYTFAPGGRIADAEFSYNPDENAWFELGPGDPATVDYNLDLLVNESQHDWLGSADGKRFAAHTFSPSHIYRIYVVGDGEPLSFRIHDTSYDWNEGSLIVKVTPVSQPKPR